MNQIVLPNSQTLSFDSGVRNATCGMLQGSFGLLLFMVISGSFADDTFIVLTENNFIHTFLF